LYFSAVYTKLHAPSAKDKGFIRFAVENDLGSITHSFVRNKEDVLPVQNILDENNQQNRKF